jgi:hypothetical protein
MNFLWQRGYCALQGFGRKRSDHAGDMLVTASRAGYAMKGTDRVKMVGAVVGKALGALENGTGVIEVLVSLH